MCDIQISNNDFKQHFIAYIDVLGYKKHISVIGSSSGSAIPKLIVKEC